MSTERPPTIDPVAAARWASLKAASSPWLHEEVGRRMAERLGWIRQKPGTWVDWEPVRGGLAAHELVRHRYPEARCHVVEASAHHRHKAEQALAKSWWQPGRWRAAQPVFDTPGDASANMVWANMGLHMAADPQLLLQRWQRLLTVDGFLMFSCLGPDTLKELRDLYARWGWPAPSHAFTDMHDWGDMLVQSGFAEPVMDMERITLTYETPQKLLEDLSSLGRNLHVARFPGLRARAWRSRLEAKILSDLGRNDAKLGKTEEKMALTFEVVYGHAFKPVPRVRVGEQSAVSLQDMRAMLHAGRSSND